MLNGSDRLVSSETKSCTLRGGKTEKRETGYRRQNNLEEFQTS